MNSDEREALPRRRIVGGLATGLAAALVTPVAAQTSAVHPTVASAPVPLANPVDLYPKPPFPAQTQPWPGLTSKMTPRPDHGEASYIGTGKLVGRKALITGGDSGIGRAVAIAYAREGADVAISYLADEEPDAQEVVQLIRNAGRKAVALPGDIRNEAFCRQLVSKAVSELGGLDIVVNNAGRQQSNDSIMDITSEQFDWTFKTNIYAMFWITKAALPYLPAGSAIINTTSVNAFNPSENLLDYSMTKGAIMIFTKALAKQMIKKGIRVNGVAPGPFWTALQVTGGQTQAKVINFGGDTPMGRAGQPAEIASTYVYLAAADSSYVTGQIAGLTGGTGNP